MLSSHSDHGSDSGPLFLRFGPESRFDPYLTFSPDPSPYHGKPSSRPDPHPGLIPDLVLDYNQFRETYPDPYRNFRSKFSPNCCQYQLPGSRSKSSESRSLFQPIENQTTSTTYITFNPKIRFLRF